MRTPKLYETVSSFIDLKLLSKKDNYYAGICPFCGDKDKGIAELVIFKDQGIFKCFSCGKGGTIFDFEYLAEKHNLQRKNNNDKEKPKSKT